MIQTKPDIEKLERHYKNLFDGSFFGIILMDLDGTILEVNSTIEKLIGYRKEDLIGENYMGFQLYPKKYYPIILDRFKNIRSGEFLDAIELELQHRDGGLNWVNIITTLIKYGDKTLILSMVEDINERKKLEQKLKESEEFFRIFDEQSLVGVALLQDNKFQYSNKIFSETTGYSCTEILNWTPGEFFNLIHPEDRKFVIEQSQKKQIGSQDVITNYIVRGFDKQGNLIWADLFSKTIQYKGRPAVLVTLLDISEKKKAEEDLKNLLKVKKDFINRASHEIKNPLTSISSAAQLLMLSYKNELSPDAQDLVAMIMKGAKRIDKIILELLDTTKIESDKLKLRKEKADIGFLIIGCIEESQLLINERKLSLSSELAPNIQLEVDKSKIQQVFCNLISNAIKNTPPGGEIAIKLKEKDEGIKLSVKDTGVGLNDDDIQQLFKQFSRIERPDMIGQIITEGTGLGLYISKEIVEKHEGKISVESAGRNMGSKFTVKLPLN